MLPGKLGLGQVTELAACHDNQLGLQCAWGRGVRKEGAKGCCAGGVNKGWGQKGQGRVQRARRVQRGQRRVQAGRPEAFAYGRCVAQMAVV